MSDTSPHSTSPQCELCKHTCSIDEFDSSAWIQFYSHMDKSQGEGVNQIVPPLKWICPQCSEDIGYTKIRDDLFSLQNACAEINLAGEIGQQCGH